MEQPLKLQSKYWMAALLAVVLVVVSAEVLNQHHQQQASRLQEDRELQEVRSQRAKGDRQVDCERIQLMVNQLTAKGDPEQALQLQTLWAKPCPNLQAVR
jgi:sensor domain CHASE-containing protein